MSAWQPYREPLRTTLVRTISIALIAGAVLASQGRVAWPLAVLVMLWPAFGGHWVDLWYLNWLRPRLPAARPVQITARLATWFAGGIVLAIGMAATARMFGGHPPTRPTVWVLGGVAFIGIELVAHFILRSRGRPSFYDGLG